MAKASTKCVVCVVPKAFVMCLFSQCSLIFMCSKVKTQIVTIVVLRIFLLTRNEISFSFWDPWKLKNWYTQSGKLWETTENSNLRGSMMQSFFVLCTKKDDELLSTFLQCNCKRSLCMTFFLKKTQKPHEDGTFGLAFLGGHSAAIRWTEKYSWFQ